jgi:hypothetical protein
MKKEMLLTALFALIIAGCQKPTEVQLVDEEPTLNVEQVDEPDPTVERAAVDSSALLPREQQKFAGFVTINSIRFDWGQGVRSIVVAKVLVENRSLPIPINNRRVFYGMPLGIVRVNGDIMLPRERRFATVSAGYEYLREIMNHVPRRTYSFTIDSLGMLPFVVQAPENLTVQSPVGGARVPRDKNLELRWTGQGDLSFVISRITTNTAGETKSQPLLNVRAKRNDGRAVLKKEFLSQLDPGLYLFTFVIANRDERVTNRWQIKTLVQASSIYNVVVGLI